MNDRVCLECGGPRPSRNPKFCSERCRHRHNDKNRSRNQPCIRCGGKKEFGVRGGRYCETCRSEAGPERVDAERARSRLKNERARRAAGIPKRPVKVNDDGQVWCPGCASYLSRARFGKSKGKKLPSRCKVCARDYQHAYRMATVFGISIDDYYEMSAIQRDRCAICMNKPRKYRLAVDHDHRTGAIRGLLCKRCNHDLLGASRDSVEMLERAVEYLKHPPAQTGDPITLHAAHHFEPGLRGENL